MTGQSDSEFYVPVGEATASLEVRRSRFVGVARKIETAVQAKSELERCRSVYPGATHVAHAFITGTTQSETVGMSDDGEPKGTAGRPILDAIRGRRLTNTLIMIVRYFGGTKLGTGGLSRAYGECAALTADRLTVQPLVQMTGFSVTVPYELYDAAIRLLHGHNAREIRETFGEKVDVKGLLPAGRIESCRRDLADVSRGQIMIEISEIVS